MPTASLDEEASSEVDDAPVVRYIQKSCCDAISAGPSDIHFEPSRKILSHPYRLDGRLIEVAQPPLVIKKKSRPGSRSFPSSNREKRVPQDGRLKLMLSKNRAIDFRVSTPADALRREERDAAAGLGGCAGRIEGLATTRNSSAVMHAITARTDVLVTGPTGSARRCRFIHSCAPEPACVNISTRQDPAKSACRVVTSQRNDKAGFTFALALRAFLLPDPDIIMVGEIPRSLNRRHRRQGCQTGHLVLASVHHNDATEHVDAPGQQGVAPFNVRIERQPHHGAAPRSKACTHCKTAARHSQERCGALASPNPISRFLADAGPVGCERACTATGPVGIF